MEQFAESDRIHPRALIVSDYSDEFSHWNARESLADWLCREKVPAITGIDTRRLTKILRENGVMTGTLRVEGCSDSPPGRITTALISWNVYPLRNLSPMGRPKAASGWCFVDCGAKNNIVRCLLRRGVEVVRVPWDYDFNNLEFDGLFPVQWPRQPRHLLSHRGEHPEVYLESGGTAPADGYLHGKPAPCKSRRSHHL